MGHFTPPTDIAAGLDHKHGSPRLASEKVAEYALDN
jgi:hypothetical protein